MKALFTHFATYLVLLISLAAIPLAIVSSRQVSTMKSSNPCFSNQQGTVYPVKGRCTSYIYCQQGLPVELPCPLGDGFSNSAKGCVDIKISDCATVNLPTTTEVPTSTETASTTISTTTNLVGCNANERRPENKAECDGKPYGSVEPYPGDCTKFLVCDCEYPTVVPCPGTMLFNPIIKRCDLRQNVNCPWSTTAMTTLTTKANSMPTTVSVTIESTSSSPTTSTDISTPSSTDSFPGTTTSSSTTSSTYESSTDSTGSTSGSSISTATSSMVSDGTTDDNPPSSITSSTEGNTMSTPTPTEKTTLDTTLSSSSTPTIGSSKPSDATTSQSKTSSAPSSTDGSQTSSDATSSTTPISTEVSPKPNTSSTTQRSESLPTTAIIPREVCFNKPGNVILPSDGNCTQYILCQHGFPEIRFCPKGFLFNPQLLICDEAEDDTCVSDTATPTAPRDVCDDVAPGTNFPYPTDCSMYLQCDGENDTPQVLRCPKNNWYSPETRTCGPNVSPDSCKQNDTASTTSAPETTPFPSVHSICSDAIDGQIIPYPNNCRKYITCVLPAPIAFDCPPNMAFSTQSLECEVSTDGSCKLDSNNSTSPSSGVCEGVPVNGTISYPENCHFYIRCYDSSYMIESCNMGEYYDPTISSCSANVSPNACKISTTTTVATSQTTAPGTSAFTDTSTPTFTTEITGNTHRTSEKSTPIITDSTTLSVAHLCQGQPDGAMIPFPHDCTKFINCSPPSPSVNSCPEGLQFSPEKYGCVNPAESGCSENESTTPLPTDSTSTETTANTAATSQMTETGATIAPPGTTVTMPDTTLVTGISTSTQSSISPNNGNICCDKPLGTHLPYPNDTHKFVICQYPLPVVFSCPTKTVFNVEKGICLNQNNTSDDLPPSNTTSGPSQSTYTTNDPLNLSTEDTSSHNPITTTLSPTVGTSTTTTTSAAGFPTNDPSNACKGQRSGSQVQYIGDCNKYNFCFANGGIVLECGSGWSFDPLTNMCVPQNKYHCPWP